MSFLEWLKSIDSEVNWLTVRDKEGLIGIEKEIKAIIEVGGHINMEAIYNSFFTDEDPWTESKEA